MASSVKYEPKFGRVIIKRETVEKTKGGIYIPETAAKRNAPCIGKIVALGETAGWTDTHDQPVQTLKVDDTVLFGRHAGTWIDGTESEDGTLFICQDQDILAVIKEQL